jgi:hypothetical protein
VGTGTLALLRLIRALHLSSSPFARFLRDDLASADPVRRFGALSEQVYGAAGNFPAVAASVGARRRAFVIVALAGVNGPSTNRSVVFFGERSGFILP